jgi:hypothetical protein
MQVDIGVFAHDEAEGIAAMVAGLLAQDMSGLEARIVVLANGCRDDTVARAVATSPASNAAPSKVAMAHSLALRRSIADSTIMMVSWFANLARASSSSSPRSRYRRARLDAQ